MINYLKQLLPYSKTTIRVIILANIHDYLMMNDNDYILFQNDFLRFPFSVIEMKTCKTRCAHNNVKQFDFWPEEEANNYL